MYRIAIEDETDARVVVAGGELDLYAAPELRARLTEVEAGDGARGLVVDLSGVSFLDSTVLGEIVRALKANAENESRSRVVLPAGSARRIFEITALDRALPVADSRADALRELRS